MSFSAQAETLSFEAEVKQILSLFAHSLYSNSEIFLRELISNASDAGDKLRYATLSDAALNEGDSTLKIWVDVDKQQKTITVRDNGIGMTREEVIENLGTIAKSGTRAFREMLENKKSATDSQLIGQFGVGFYSAFVVADRVVVKTRRAGMQADQGVMWESDGQGQYTVKNIHHPARGTEVVLHVKTECEEFLDESRLRNIITKYSDHIVLPIVMKKPEPAEDKSALKTSKEAMDEKNETVIPEEEVVNRANALWTLPKSEVTDEQYKDLYKHIAHDFEEPLAWTHNKLEGKLEYTSLLYIPARAPFDLWNREYQRGLKLYVKRVFIMDDAEHFMPMYLRFIKGVIDSNDLPLNISRELLQSNQLIEKMRSGSVKRVLDLLEKLVADEPATYAKFWKEFGAVLKEGPAEDYANKDRIAKLLRFASTHQADDVQNVSLTDYTSRLQEGQDKIYYLTADSYLSAKNSPLLEVFRKKGIEVLLLSDRVDEWLMTHLTEFEGKKFQSVSKGKLDLDKTEDKVEEQQQQEKAATFADVVQRIKTALGDRVKDVRLTHRLVDSPACVVFDENELTGHMQRLLKAAGQTLPESKPILELNPDHRLLLKLQHIQDSQKVADWANILLSQALLAEGEQLQNPADFVKRLNQLLIHVEA
jgi:molecular chaperone HtpG